ncbi:Uncharacterized conserved protein YafD, endonuclease/exonuclease/phosphatase (EEP) superfamily [Citreimonas salinaria]|uniref:Uncharacterized conserved protein YafD, endonuclease/exonuclease/phosphatase (EEP) superfamily n=1 Tax=Citreimonas salinaria TaxID=321339 RepID=A0A1H3NVW8_9RHOB|nr:Uncharacterized conserved protein YafD, endonuclease/exonuclease/phosphatase (EEP) superfamily [Citreimonas salinaria]
MSACAARLVLSFVVALATVTFLPLIDTNTWWIRYLDFPRVQIFFCLLILTAIAIILRSQISKVGTIVVGIGLLALGHQAFKLYPFSSLSANAAESFDTCSTGSSFTLLIANVRKRNEDAAAFLNVVEAVNPDLLLILETDNWWDRSLQSLDDRFPEKVQFIPEGHGAFGMHVFSRLPLINPEFQFLFDGYTPMAVMGVKLRSGAVVQFVGVHPHPPLAWSQPTTLRDASLLQAALLAGSSPSATIVAGAFNSVPWEPVTRRAARIGRLLDPRIGRGIMPTFRVDSSLISWPLDQILFQEEFGLLEFGVLPAFGSDHYPVTASLCHAPGRDGLAAAPEANPGDIAEAEDSIEEAKVVGATNDGE